MEVVELPLPEKSLLDGGSNDKKGVEKVIGVVMGGAVGAVESATGLVSVSVPLLVSACT